MTVEVLPHRNAKSNSIFFLTHQNRASPFLGHDTTPIAGKAMAPPTSTLDKYATRVVSAFWKKDYRTFMQFYYPDCMIKPMFATNAIILRKEMQFIQLLL